MIEAALRQMIQTVTMRMCVRLCLCMGVHCEVCVCVCVQRVGEGIEYPLFFTQHEDVGGSAWL